MVYKNSKRGQFKKGHAVNKKGESKPASHYTDEDVKSTYTRLSRGVQDMLDRARCTRDATTDQPQTSMILRPRSATPTALEAAQIPSTENAEDAEMDTYNEKTTRVPVLSHQATRVKTYHLSAKREGDEFFTEGGLVNENSNEGGFLFIMNLKI